MIFKVWEIHKNFLSTIYDFDDILEFFKFFLLSITRKLPDEN